MKKTILLLAVLLCTAATYAQHTFSAIIKDSETNAPLAKASVALPLLNQVVVANDSGMISLSNLPTGKQIISFSYLGYIKRTDTLTFPLAQSSPMVILLQPAAHEEELEEVVVLATRSSRTIANIPTRVEVL